MEDREYDAHQQMKDLFKDKDRIFVFITVGAH